jgi:hypothetical protein
MKTPAATLPILPAGQHVALDGRPVEFTESVLREIAQSYNPALHDAPLVIGHPTLNGPAYGWTKSLEVRGGMLYAEPHQVVPEFAEAANRKMYKKRSASVYLPDSPGNPTPGKHYLRHIGFLGAMPPAIKGIPDASLEFGEGDGGVAVEFSELPYTVTGVTDILRRMRDFFIEREGAERAEQLIPQYQLLSIEAAAARDPAAFAEPHTEKGTDPTAASAVAAGEPAAGAAPRAGTVAPPADGSAAPTSPNQETTMTDETALAERERLLTERERQVADSEAQIAKQATEEKRREATEFAEGLVTAGKLLPRQKGPVVELMLSLPAAPLEFSEGGAQVSKPGNDVLRELLTSLPKQVDFAEKSRDTGRDVDADDASAIAAKARVYQAEQAKAGNHISISAAVRHVKKGLKP